MTVDKSARIKSLVESRVASRCSNKRFYVVVDADHVQHEVTRQSTLQQKSSTELMMVVEDLYWLYRMRNEVRFAAQLDIVIDWIIDMRKSEKQASLDGDYKNIQEIHLTFARAITAEYEFEVHSSSDINKLNLENLRKQIRA